MPPRERRVPSRGDSARVTGTAMRQRPERHAAAVPPALDRLIPAGNRAVSHLVGNAAPGHHPPDATTLRRKVVDAIITTPTHPRMRSEDDTSLVHGRSGKKLELDSKISIEDNKTFKSRLQTDETPPDKAYRDNEKDTVWFRMGQKIDGVDGYIRTGTFRLDPAGTDVASMVKVATKQRLPFRIWMTTVIESYGASTKSIDVLLPHIEKTPQDERDSVVQDQPLMEKARINLDRDVYLALLPALGAYETPETKLKEATGTWTSHMKGPEADEHIHDYMQQIGMEVVTKGRKVEGEVSVVSGKAWDEAFFRQWGPFGYTNSNVCNAFVDVNLPKRHIWVNKDKGNSGTVLHEGMHKYADPTLRDSLITEYKLKGVSRIDEGLTELFTREITIPLGIVRKNYAEDYDVMEKLQARVGKSTVRDAYFAGKYDTLMSAYTSKAKRPWAEFSEPMEKKDYATALHLA